MKKNEKKIPPPVPIFYQTATGSTWIFLGQIRRWVSGPVVVSMWMRPYRLRSVKCLFFRWWSYDRLWCVTLAGPCQKLFHAKTFGSMRQDQYLVDSTMVISIRIQGIQRNSVAASHVNYTHSLLLFVAMLWTYYIALLYIPLPLKRHSTAG